jgi:hypothetical protein
VLSSRPFESAQLRTAGKCSDPWAAVNLFDVAYGIRGDRVERELPITGRGKVR